MKNHTETAKKAIKAQVKLAIDSFDPFVFCPGQDAPADEYDGESERIAEKLYTGVSKDEIEEIIAEEFTRSFGQEFTKEACSSPAFEIYEYVNSQSCLLDTEK